MTMRELFSKYDKSKELAQRARKGSRRSEDEEETFGRRRAKTFQQQPEAQTPQ